MRADRIHTLLPWYANGTLEPDEQEAFERHLGDCDPCRDELGTVEAMRAEVARHGEAFFDEHPEPEILGSLFGIGDVPLDAAAEDRVRRHLAVCATCSEESRWLSGAETADAGRPHELAARTVPRADSDLVSRGTSRAEAPAVIAIRRTAVQPLIQRLWPAVAAAAIVVIATILVPGPWRGGYGSGPVAHGFLRQTTRAASSIVEVLVRPEHAAIVLDIPSDLTPEQLPARVEILDAAGRTVHRETGLHAAGPGGDILTIVLPRAALPPGAYVARLYGAALRDEPPTEFHFSIVAQAP